MKKKKNLIISSQMKNVNISLLNLSKIKFQSMKMILQKFIQKTKLVLMHKTFLFLKQEKESKEIY